MSTKFKAVVALLALSSMLAACGDEEDPGREQPDCGPANCGGCCIDNICYIGIRTTACGSTGGVCVDCRTFGSDYFCHATGEYPGAPGSIMACLRSP
jgi:hypothetical protein